ncbi:type B 50S ribosomal protein L31 [Marinomonas ostreistagni]|uniref:Large ribosomal subunit protein bL31B n=1 Tax=Marinomonas ostreistagni TaxID=359209 RepID=A0ABS0ZE97_9GAMM|nr:type B 50S ribosomal protein L31 [Marinomonas ostreistagni]MBJ7552004.1 type B 50S ribosomal protein L31 [Marinomonas ostreistagni]RUM56216.1 MAG: 50S ribosomal protein L31 [Marinomonas sp.]
MRSNIHPEYRTVVFHDTSVDTYFLIKTTLQTSQTIEWKDGNTYPYHTIDISSASHPVYTGEQRATQLEGRVQNFKRRFGSRQLKGAR